MVTKKSSSRSQASTSTDNGVLCGRFDMWHLILGALALTFLILSQMQGALTDKMDKAQEFVIHKGKTWIQVEGSPLHLTIVGDESCGQACDTGRALSIFRQNLSPALVINAVDITSKEGQGLVEKFDLTFVPAYILGEGVKDLTRDGKPLMDELLPILTEKDGQYLVESRRANLPVGKFINDPEFDFEGEPVRGSGKVKVVEFTDFQCPFCKRLYDQNKDLIERLIKENKITYVLKDFPLSFHQQAMGMHIAANCAFKLGGIDSFSTFKQALFDEQETWSGQDTAGFIDRVRGDAGLDRDSFAACLKNPDIKKEIEADLAEGSEYGVTGTPSVFIGSQMMPGAIGPDVFEKAVNDQL